MTTESQTLDQPILDEANRPPIEAANDTVSNGTIAEDVLNSAEEQTKDGATAPEEKIEDNSTESAESNVDPIEEEEGRAGKEKPYPDDVIEHEVKQRDLENIELMRDGVRVGEKILISESVLDNDGVIRRDKRVTLYPQEAHSGRSYNQPPLPNFVEHDANHINAELKQQASQRMDTANFTNRALPTKGFGENDVIANPLGDERNTEWRGDLKVVGISFTLNDQDQEKIFEKIDFIAKENPGAILLHGFLPTIEVVDKNFKLDVVEKLFETFPAQINLWNEVPLRRQMAIVAKLTGAKIYVIGQIAGGVKEEVDLYNEYGLTIEHISL